MSRNLRIILGWLTAAVLLGPGIILIGRPLAGLFVFLVIASAMCVLVGPAIHIGAISLMPEPQGRLSRFGPVLVAVGGMLALFFLLVASGAFNFA